MSISIDLSGHVALITGGTKGLGRGIAQRLEAYGARIVVCARQPIEDLPSGWDFLAVDLRDGDAAWACVDQIVERHGRIDLVVNNAGGTPSVDTTSASPRLTERLIALNLLAAMFVSQRANHHMQTQDGGGSIVNIGSISGLRPTPLSAAYGAAKAALINYSMTVAQEWAPRVRVNCLALGMVQTEFGHSHYGDEEGVKRINATIPAGRMARSDEVGDACAWLASPLSSYVTGANIAMHGGGERPPFLDAAAG
jgi:NAD(P)-dependent dehydrogenase (short-subunit alcohol dehydrogenase family)